MTMQHRYGATLLGLVLSLSAIASGCERRAVDKEMKQLEETRQKVVGEVKEQAAHAREEVERVQEKLPVVRDEVKEELREMRDEAKEEFDEARDGLKEITKSARDKVTQGAHELRATLRSDEHKDAR